MANPWEQAESIEPIVEEVSDVDNMRRQQARDDYNFGEAALISAGREFDKMGSGIADIYDSMLMKVSSDPKRVEEIKARRKARAEDQASKDEMFSYLEDEHGGATLTGQVAPYLLTGPTGLYRAGISGLTRAGATAAGKQIPKWAAKNAVEEIATKSASTLAKEAAAQNAKFLATETGLGTAQGAAHYDDTALAGGLMGLGGAWGGKAVGNFLGGTSKTLGQETQRVVDWAKSKNLFVPPGMATGNKALQQLDAAFSTHGKTAQLIQEELIESYSKQNKLMTGELASKYKDLPESELFSRSWLDKADEVIGNHMDDLAKKTKMVFNGSKIKSSYDILQDAAEEIPDGQIPKILSDWDENINKWALNGDEFTGKQFQAFRKKLNRQIKSNRGTPIADALEKYKIMLDDAVEDSMTSDSLKESWRSARRDYALYNAFEKAYKSGRHVKGVSELGYINPRDVAKNFDSSDTINMLDDFEKLRERQAGTSLSTSGILGRALAETATGGVNEGLGSLMALSSRTPGAGPITDLMTKWYHTGIPHATGVAPILGRELTEPFFKYGISRSLMAPSYGGSPELEE